MDKTSLSPGLRVLAPFLLALLLLLGAGCASVDPQPLFDHLRVDLKESSGLEASWPRDAGQLADVEAQIRALLAEDLDAERASRVALLNNRHLLAELEELGIGQADLAQASRVHNPSLELSRRTLEGGGGTQAEASIALDLLDVLIAPQRRKLAEIELEALRLRTARLLQETVAETQIAVAELQAIEQKVGALELLRDLDASASDMAKRQHAAGNLSDRDFARHEMHAKKAEVTLSHARLEAGVARETLQRQMGLSGPEPAWRLAATWPSKSERDPSLDGLEALALHRRYDLRAARAAVNLVGKALALKKGTRFFPLGVEVGVSTEREPEGARLIGPTLVLELPIFDTGKASITRLEAEERKARRQLEALEVEARSQVREAHDALESARELTNFHQQVLLPQQAFLVDQTLRHYNMMLEGVYELIDARKEEVEEQIAAGESERDYWIARARLELAVGASLPSEGGKS